MSAKRQETVRVTAGPLDSTTALVVSARNPAPSVVVAKVAALLDWYSVLKKQPIACCDPPIATQVAAAREWNRWDLSIGSLKTEEADFQALDDEAWSVPHAVLEAHYSINDFWLDDGQILKEENMDKIKHIPGISMYTRKHEGLR